MKHDENVEKYFDENHIPKYVNIDNSVQYDGVIILMKQYAEHMVQQERERVLDFINNLKESDDDVKESRDSRIYNIALRNVIKAINKQ